ncbi:hypothetical protein DTO013E5_8658 [Penicillium roqueforti]|uniref:Epidermal growth factor receptor-like transmembrane-juxtamembrane segment domain-containing protein n=1 Tax=Penicillium roqueforti (strain FM164) TaxID=1365484 RepID=W6QQG0_PENRF|nr:uncharacterized protein N7518_005939 [Penicillium psychrosexuale]KAI2697161.1 hypothetical protein CBS147372_7899 [Penicillium roqueforti]CDM38226.1 unnamed protein product [Penicillium roqueforti FM164]KAI2710872.1 hypothetical protein CBS147354_8452 [Penicillium roqueforti]KAI2736398.1 hypothetical protein DTO012A1_8381 [Penicillium roqueforti]KAI2744932.1 hypothetical protein DTO013F2_7662 [Penicillium roqueforti]
MSEEYVKGYAIRRNSTCETGENQCTKKATWGDYQACCPGNSFCFDSDTGIPNIICCDNHNNCTQAISVAPACADRSWNLFDGNGSFCCDQGESGFRVENRVLVGCSEATSPGNASFITLPTISVGKSVASSTATSSSSPSSSSPSSPSTSKVASNSSSASSSTNVGAIAGGVVGGVAGVAAIAAILFFFVRRRKQQNTQTLAQTPYSPPVYSEVGAGLPRKELDGQTRSEMDDTPLREPQELPTSH